MRRARARSLCRIARYVWAAPNSLLGAAIGLVVLMLGGRGRLREGAVEFSGGRLGRMLAAQRGPRFCAITFGHVILGLDEAELDRVRAHEHVHVRQCERWGPLFLPAYLLSSLWQVLRGRRAYLDNAFEREAYEKTGAPGARRLSRDQ